MLRRRRGIALPFVLFIIALLLVAVSTVTKQGLGSLQQAKVSEFSKQALFAAEAGANDAMRQLVEDPSWAGPLALTSMSGGSEYTATILNNITPGSGTQIASNGAEVPEGFAYILATGYKGTVSRKVGLLVSPGSSSAFGVAVGVGGNLRMQGSKTVQGSIKASGDIRFQGSSSFQPVNGNGRILAGGNIRSQGSTSVDAAQDVRARGLVNATPAFNGANTVVSSDTTDSTLPFIADYRTTNQLLAGERGLVLPNPDQTVLLDPTNPDFVNHPETSVSGGLSLGGQIHYFPNGVEFTGSTNITGPGTIVVGNGNQMRFQGSANVDANLIALRNLSQQPAGGDPSIRFQGSSNVTGLVYAHEDVRFQGSSDVTGAVIAYRDGGGDLRTQGSTQITLDSTVFANIPGFESWASGFGGVGAPVAGSGPISVVSWERQ